MRRNGRGSVTVQLPGGESQLAEIVRVLDQANLKVETLQLHQPSLDDVFLAKTGRKLEGSGDGGGCRSSRRAPPARAEATWPLRSPFRPRGPNGRPRARAWRNKPSRWRGAP